ALQVGVADDVAADDRAPARGMRVDDRGPPRARRRAGPVALVALEDAPAEVRAARPPAPREVDLLPASLADVADRDVAGRPVEREAEGVAQPVRVDERLRAAPRRIDPQDLAEQRAAVLGVALRVALAAAVAGRDVEQPVRPELELAAV